MATIVNRTASRVLLTGALATSLLSLTARAQETATPPPVVTAQAEPAAAPAPPPPPAPAPAPAPDTVKPAAVTVEPAAPGVALAAKAPEVQHKKMDPPAIWFRLDNQAQNPKDHKKLDGFSLGSEVDVLFSGEVHQYVAWQADFVATFGNQQSDPTQKMTGHADILDLIGKFNLHDSFNIWVGRMLVPSDRSNFSGPWFMIPWNYPGFYKAGPPIGPRQGPFGRNDGATVWGQFFGGYAKYYLGAFDLHDADSKAMVSGRLNFSLLNPEPGYYHSSTYYGGKDIVALGLGAQFKKQGSAQTTAAGMLTGMSEDYSELNADLLLEKKLGESGVGTIEAGVYKFNGQFEPVKSHFYVLAAYLIPTVVGIGRFHPQVRYQQATPQVGDAWRMVDVGIGYVVDEYAMRIALNYQNSKVDGLAANIFQIGIQIQK